MAGNAGYDLNAPGTLSPAEFAAAQQQTAIDEAARQQVLANQAVSPMIAPAPIAMSPVEQYAAQERQNLANMGNVDDLASMQAEATAAQAAFPEQQDMHTTASMQSGEITGEQPVEDLNAKYGLQAESKTQKPKEVLDLFGPMNQQLKAQDQLNNAAQTLEKNKQQVLGNQEKIQQERIAQFQEMKNKYDFQIGERMKAIDAELAQVDADAKQARKSTADLFSEKSTGQKIAAGLAMFLGVAHAGLAGGNVKGGNMGVQVIEDALQKEKDNNLNKFANSKQMLDLKRKNMDDYIQAMQNQEQLADKQQLLQMQVVKTKLEQAESVYRGSAAGAAATQGKALINEKIMGMKQQIAQSEALRNMIQNGNLESLTPIQTMGLPENMQKAIEATRGLKVPGYQGVALSKEDRDQFQKYRQTTEPAISGLQRILDLQKNTSRLSLQDRARIASEVNAATGALREAIVGPGAMTQQEYERLVATIGNPNKLFSLPSWERAKTMTALNKLKADLSVIAKSRGLVPPPEFRGNFNKADEKSAEEILNKYVNKK